MKKILFVSAAVIAAISTPALAQDDADESIAKDGIRNNCLIAPVCGLKPMFAGAAAALLEHLGQFHLSDVVADRRAFAELFESRAA